MNHTCASAAIAPSRGEVRTPGASGLIDRIAPSGLHPGYLQAGDGRVFVPVGLNLCFPRFVTGPEEGVRLIEGWMGELARAGGNFVRFWLGHPFLDIEPGRAGEYDGAAFDRIIGLLDTALELGLRVKLTLDHFRDLGAGKVAEAFAGAANFSRPQYALANGGPAADMNGFWLDGECRRAYLRRLDRLAAKLGDHPAIMAIELWNEINACSGEGWREWTEAMLPELRRRFPHVLCLQSLGSFCADYTSGHYRWLCALPGNDLVQVHRYLDLGAEWPVCRGPVDVLSADAVRKIREWAPGRAVLLAEGGAVEPNHAAPFALYERDRDGAILHDVLFAPFFAGAAGTGQCWHWDFYVARHGLWWHFGRFVRAIGDFDPIGEQARPRYHETRRLRVYVLKGRRSSLVWLRDIACDWHRELLKDEAPGLVEETLSLAPDLGGVSEASYYDPWTDVSGPVPVSPDGFLTLPGFRRSLTLRLRHA